MEKYVNYCKNLIIMAFKTSRKIKEALKKAFGSLDCNMPTQEIMDEIDEGYYE